MRVGRYKGLTKTNRKCFWVSWNKGSKSFCRAVREHAKPKGVIRREGDSAAKCCAWVMTNPRIRSGVTGNGARALAR